jgi:predicted O-methyltransferase YrrM
MIKDTNHRHTRAYENPDLDSSYKENDIGQTLYDIVMDLKPKKIVEFGALNGYSAICMAQALRNLGKGQIDSYDLWGKYEFKHTTIDEARQNARLYDVQDYIEFHYGDIFLYQAKDWDLMHVDVSNDGDKIKKIYERFKDHPGTIIFEGGTIERDNVEWVKKFKRKPIMHCGVPYEVLNPAFPGLSIIKKHA